MKLAYFVLPHMGGTYTVFRHLRAGLAAHDIEVEWLGVCGTDFVLPPDMAEESAFGALIRLEASLPQAAAARRVAGVIAERGYDGVIINVLGDRMQTNIARYLPADVMRIMVVHNITPGTYAAAASIRDYVHATVCVAERARHDLVERYGFSPERTTTIANAVDVAAFTEGSRRRTTPKSDLRVLFAGRIEDASKGVLWLPDIFDGLPDAIALTVVGDGPDSARLARRFKASGSRARFAGPVPAATIPAVMVEHDVLIMPSRYEGLPLTLIEGMAAGCVPVISDIRGVTDTIVDDGTNGLLFPVGHYSAAAAALLRLHEDRALLETMSAAARRRVADHYSVRQMAMRYRDVIAAVRAQPAPILPVLDFDRWSMPRGLRSGFRTFLPLPLKNWLRVMRERI